MLLIWTVKEVIKEMIPEGNLKILSFYIWNKIFLFSGHLALLFWGLLHRISQKMLEGRQNLQLVSLEVVDFEVCLGLLSIWRGLPLFNFNKFDVICICAGVAGQCSTTPLVGLLQSTVLTCFSSSPMSGSSCFLSSRCYLGFYCFCLLPFLYFIYNWGNGNLLSSCCRLLLCGY